MQKRSALRSFRYFSAFLPAPQAPLPHPFSALPSRSRQAENGISQANGTCPCLPFQAHANARKFSYIPHKNVGTRKEAHRFRQKRQATADGWISAKTADCRSARGYL